MKLLHVAVAVVFNSAGQVLISKRHPAAHQGGKWEFPGGKVEANESVVDALHRELLEEVNLTSIQSSPFIKIKHHYIDQSVLLDVWCINAYKGDARSNENQEIKWSFPSDLIADAFPAANKPIVIALRLPDYCLITPEYHQHKSEYFIRLREALISGVRLVQLRDPSLSLEDYRALALEVRVLCQEYGAQLILNADPVAIQTINADGVHLNTRRLFAYQSRPVAPSILLSASCHNESEVKQAIALDVDFIFISPVQKTVTHADLNPLGWDKFSALAELANKPVYALGGLAKKDLTHAKIMGARGVAGIRGFFTSD